LMCEDSCNAILDFLDYTPCAHWNEVAISA
jgi:hypothetical protein